jgi:hypothetical protein
MTFPSFHFTTLTYPSHAHHILLHFTSPHFTSLITFLALFLKLLSLQERVPKASAGSWFQTWMVQFTKQYFPISVFCFLLPIFLSWLTLLRYHGFSNLSPIASQARSPVYALNRAHMRDISMRCVNVSEFESFLWWTNLAAVFCNRSSAFNLSFPVRIPARRPIFKNRTYKWCVG